MRSETKNSKNILLVDDDESLRGALQKNLEKLGYMVTCAENGAHGFDLFKTLPFDLVISDIRMPQMDGIELTKRIRAAGGTPVILITGFSELLETKEAHRIGATDFLPKPFERSDLEKSISRCFQTPKSDESVNAYCKLPIADFMSGKQILFNVFLKLSDIKYVKIAYKGEDLSMDRIRAYQEKGIHNLYLLKDDFKKYVGFSLKLNQAVKENKGISSEKKLNLARHTAEVMLTHIVSHGLDKELFEDSSSFVESVVDNVSDDESIATLLEMLRNQSDYHYAHCVGVSFYSAAMAKAVGWDMATNRFKVTLGGLVHDIGEKEIPQDILSKARPQWSVADVRIYEGHPLRGVEILSQIPSIPDDVLQIVKQHHEDGVGFPLRLKKSQIHPMAKLIAVADMFCYWAIPNPQCATGLQPNDAIVKMETLYSERLDRPFFNALRQLFKSA